MSAARALIDAVLVTLRADADLAAGLAGRIWDTAPRDPDFPHLVVEDATARDRSGLDAPLEEIRLALKVFSRTGGRAEAARLAERAEAVLASSDPPLDGARLTLLRREATETRIQRDRRTAEATLRLVALIEPD